MRFDPTGTACMPTTTARYGRPKGSGLDDSRQLATVAALLNANPKLNPTAAIRSLGIEDPSVIRRLRDKYRIEQMKIAAGVSSANSEAALASGSVPTLVCAPRSIPRRSRTQ
jgi:hypothetical protein